MLSAVIVSVESMAASLAFHRDALGLEVLARGALPAGVAPLLGGPGGLGGECVLLGGPAARSDVAAARVDGSATGVAPAERDPLDVRSLPPEASADVGRVLLVQFASSARERIRQRADTLDYGLQNLNCYVADCTAAAERFAAAGYELWSPPTRHEFTASVGAPVELIFEGPDGVAINLVELATQDAATRIGQMRAFVAGIGYTPTGFTPVVTTSHVVPDRDAAVAVHRDVLGMQVLFDDELASDAANRFLRLPAGSRTRVTFMKGAHAYGKVALSQPLNYRRGSLAARALAPNVGYLAQLHRVARLDAAIAAAHRLGVVATAPVTLALPGYGTRLFARITHPGSGAPLLLTE